MAITPFKSPSLILENAYKRKAKRNTAYSRSALARDLGVSSAFVTNLLTGKKFPPPERIPQIFRVLELDNGEQKEFIQSLILAKEKDKSFRKMVEDSFDFPRHKKTQRTTEPADYNLLGSWYNLAVMEGLSLRIVQDNIKVLPKILSLKSDEFEHSLKVLSENKLIKYENEKWIKNEDHIFLNFGKSKSHVRSFHAQMIERARLELIGRQLDTDFERRLITGFTFALNPEKTQLLKTKIQEFLGEISVEASEGECSEVYQFNVQFFPLTKRV